MSKDGNYLSPAAYIKLLERIEKLEAGLDNLEGYMAVEYRVRASDILSRLSSLESENNIYCGAIFALENWRRKSEEELSVPMNKISYVTPIKVIPYKCPVCLGTTFQNEATFFKCNACEGKGIVWG